MIVQINSGPGSGKTYTAINSHMHMIARIPLKMKTSDEQEVIFEFVRQHFKYPKKVAFFCLNNTTKEKLKKQVHKTADVYNFHGFGQSQIVKMFGYHTLDKGRTEGFIEDITGKHLADMPHAEKWHWLACKKLVTYLKQEFLSPTEMNKEFVLLKYADMSDYTLPADWIERCHKLMNLSSVPNRKLEYIDMMWLAARKIKRPLYQLGIVDESQDNSAVSLALLRASCENLIFFGDPNQAINAFAGADHEMFNKVEDMADHTFPLKQTFRCPAKVVELANSIRPGGVIPGPNEREAEIKTIPYAEMQHRLTLLPPESTLIVSRTNASIIGCALRLLTTDPQVPCYIPEKDLYANMKKFVESMYPKSIDDLWSKLDDKKADAEGMRNSLAALNLFDKCIAVEYFLENSDDISELFYNMETVLKRKGGHKILTLHSAKGLEAHNIFILNPPVEHPLALKNPIACQQEYNLHFVGITRSSHNLYYVK